MKGNNYLEKGSIFCWCPFCDGEISRWIIRQELSQEDKNIEFKIYSNLLSELNKEYVNVKYKDAYGFGQKLLINKLANKIEHKLAKVK